MTGEAAREGGRSGVAVIAVAAVYAYFLLFAEFALLRLVAPTEPFGAAVKGVLGALGTGGIAGSVAAAVGWRARRQRGALAGGLLGCALTAGAAWAAAGRGLETAGVGALVGGGVGLALGWTTVTLAVALRGLVGERRVGRVAGLGTGLAYAVCNVPLVFEATPAQQTLLTAGLALGGAVVAWRGLRGMSERAEADGGVVPAARAGDFSRAGVVLWVAWLALLVGLDSGAFYAIQQTAETRAALWAGDARLWGNAAVHLGAAWGAGWWLDRGGRAAVAGTALALLVAADAGIALGHEHVAASLVAAGYTAGVSLYSVALVEYPARSGRPGIAAAVYALAGWVASALGIGLVRGAGDVVPLWLVVGAAGAVPGLWLARRAVQRRAVAGFITAGAVVAGMGVAGGEARADESGLVARGRGVYIAEGCMHCHSQFVRPRTADVKRWGPERTLADQLAGEPPLPGNRRQGPDLTNVGNRRSPAWQEAHLREPRALVSGSRMPGYAHLFAMDHDGNETRGAALVAYLASLGADTVEARRAQIAAWRPVAGAGEGEGVASDGSAELTADRRGWAERQFAALCASCHGAAGEGNGPLASHWAVRPPDLRRGGLPRVRATARDSNRAEERVALARVILFGVPGTDMPGHEVLPEADALGLAALVQEWRHAAGLAATGREGAP